MPRSRKCDVLSSKAARELGLDFEISILERALEWDPDDLVVLDSIGHAYTARGLNQKGLEVDLRLTRLDPKNPTFAYNLGCSLSLLGRLDESIAAIERAIDLGFRDPRLLATDPDLKAVRTHARFPSLVRRAVKLGAS